MASWSLDDLNNPFLDDITNPFDDAAERERQQVAGQSNFALNVASSPVGSAVLGTLSVAGRVLQPFAAPQQVIFGGLGALEDLATGQGAQKAWETLQRGFGAAGDYLTWGLTARKNPLGWGDAKDAREKAITGFELFKKVGAPDWLAKTGGLVADFGLDVPLIGWAAKTTKLNTLTRSIAVGANMANSFADPGALQAFARGVLQAPFTTQPIKNLVEAVPQGVRDRARASTVDRVLDFRITPTRMDEATSPSLGQFLVSRYRNVPEEVARADKARASVLSQYAVLSNEVLTAWQQAKKGLSFQDARELDGILGRLADESSVGGRAILEGDIRAMEARTGRTGLLGDALAAVNKGVAFDTWSAESLHRVGLMSKETLGKFQSGERRHLRRAYAFYGESAPQQVQRILDRGRAASVSFDDAELTRIFDATFNQGAYPGELVAKTGVASVPSVDGLRVYHGTMMPFDELAFGRQTSTRPNANGGVFFAEDPKVAAKFSDSYNSKYGTDVYSLIDQARGLLGRRGASDDALMDIARRGDVEEVVDALGERGFVPFMTDETTGLLRRANREEALAAPESTLFYPPDANPRVLEREVHGRLLDIRSADTIPDDLVESLRTSRDMHDRNLARYFLQMKNPELDQFGKPHYVPPNFEAPPNSPLLKAYLEENGYVGVRMRDSFNKQGDDYESIYVVDGRAVRPVGSGAPNTPPSGGNPTAFGSSRRTARATAQEFIQAFKDAYRNPREHPADVLRRFFDEKGFDVESVDAIMTRLAGSYTNGKAGVTWQPADDQIAAMLQSKLYEDKRPSLGAPYELGNQPKAVAQREELSAWYADALGEITSFSQRVQLQAKTVGKLVGSTGTVRDIRAYLESNGLIEHLGGTNARSVINNAGLRVVSGDLAKKLGNGFQEGEYIPAEVHRILAQTVNARDPKILGALWQWYSSRWNVTKLANPGSIMTNIQSAFVMADRAGMSVPELTRGIVDYMRLHRAATRADGALDATVRVHGVTMRELFDHGDFTHNTLLQKEVSESTRMLDVIANPSGGTLQQKAAQLAAWFTDTAGGQRLRDGYSNAVAPLRWMGDLYGRTDSVFKGGAYMMLRKKGVKPEEAARIANETFFDYQNVPYAVDGLRRLGLLGVPFASYKFLAFGRFFRDMYQNPYAVQRYYRVPNSLSQGTFEDERERDAYPYAAPEFVKKSLWVPLGKDEQGRVRAVQLSHILPESVVFDAADSDNVLQAEPPMIALWRQIVSGKGYQGRSVYAGGEGYFDTAKVNPTEATRGVVRSLWQFGAYPWAPGQPMTERLVKALVDRSVPVEDIDDPKVQAVLKFFGEGAAAPWADGPAATVPKGGQELPDVTDAALRFMGLVKSYPVALDRSQPGSARNNLIELEQRIKLLDAQMDSEMKRAMTPQQRDAVKARFKRLRDPIIEALRTAAAATSSVPSNP